MGLVIRLLINALAIYIAAQVVPGIRLADLKTALFVAIVLGVINAVVRPVLLLLTLPINFLTLGLFTFVINALMIILASSFVGGFRVESFFAALIFSVLVSLVSGFLTWVAR